MDKYSSHTLEITILSAEDLRINGRSVKKSAFAIVRIDPFNYLGTKADPLGGSYPSWDEKLTVNLPMGATSLTLEVQSKTSSGNRLIGVANLPVSDIIGGNTPESYLRFLSYILKDGRGNKNGIINVSARVKEAERASSSPDYAAFPSTVAGYGCPPHKMAIPIGDRNCEGVVTGIPVWPPNHA